jgi:hypothetical protein
MRSVIETAAKPNLKPVDVQELASELTDYYRSYDPLFLVGNNPSTSATSRA